MSFKEDDYKIGDLIYTIVPVCGTNILRITDKGKYAIDLMFRVYIKAPNCRYGAHISYCTSVGCCSDFILGKVIDPDTRWEELE